MGELTISVAKAIAEGQGATAWEVYQLARSFLHAHGIEAPAFATHPQPVTPAGGEVSTAMIEGALCAPYGDGDVSDMLRGGGDEETEIMRAALNAAETARKAHAEKTDARFAHPPVADAALLRRVIDDNHACGHTTPETLNAIDAALNQRGGG